MTTEIRELIDKLNYYRDEYYNKNTSVVSDLEYDSLFDKLLELEEKTGLIYADSPTQSVGYESVSQLQKVEHDHPLLSLGKTTDLTEFVRYFGGFPTVYMAKMDGLTCSIRYENGVMVRAESRGNGIVGEDITHNARVFSNLPQKIPFTDTLIVDGECIIDYAEFEKINEREHTEYKHPRNLASGTVRQLDSSICAARHVKFVAWKLQRGDGKAERTYITAFKFLKELGFTVVPYYGEDRESVSVANEIIDKIQEDCRALNYPIDGIVGTFNSVEYGLSLGNTAHHPKHSYAFKFYQEDNETVLRDIEWNVTRTGAVNPVAIFDPVEIDGTTVSRATLNNVSIIKELELGIGDTITVIKANQIIPQITGNLTRSGTYKIPAICPCCGRALTIKDDAGREVLYCPNETCPDKILDSLSHFVSRNGMNIMGLSDERLRLLIDNGLISHYIDLYYLQDKAREIEKLPKMGMSSVEKLLKNIEVSRTAKLENVIYALGIPNVGKSAAKIIADYCNDHRVENTSPLGTFWNLGEYGGANWAAIDGFGATIQDSINRYMYENGKWIELLDACLDMEWEEKTGDNSLYGKVFCITGKLNTFPNRDALVKDIESRGGKVVSGVTAKTDYLITNDKDSGSSKNKAAQKFGTKIITEQEYIEVTQKIY